MGSQVELSGSVGLSTDRLTHLAWFVGIAVLAFGIPYAFSASWGLDHDLYYLVYFALSGGALWAYASSTGVDVADVFRRSWALSLVLGLLAAAFLVINVLRGPATPAPGGGYFAFEVLWRGIAYGAVDALLLSAFPGVVAYSLLGGDLRGLMQHVGYFALALVLTLIMTTTYHLGYTQYRAHGFGQANGMMSPEIGNTIISVPMLVTANPAGSLVAHVAMHVAAVSHAYETDIYLPPQTMAR